MKISITINSLIRHIGEEQFEFIIDEFRQTGSYNKLYPERVTDKYDYMDEMGKRTVILKPLFQSLRHLARMRHIDSVLELSTEEFEAFMFFKNDEQ